MLRQERGAYTTSDVPAVVGDTDAARELRLALYREVCTTWRGLVDVRFKLLALLPPVSFVVVGGLVQAQDRLPRPALVVAATLGLAVSVGLFVYDRRNSELHDFLISRGRRLESELGVATGQFLGRPRAKSSLVQHDTALSLVYGAVIALWLLAGLVFVNGRI